jgi:hypothetical protein
MDPHRLRSETILHIALGRNGVGLIVGRHSQVLSSWDKSLCWHWNDSSA